MKKIRKVNPLKRKAASKDAKRRLTESLEMIVDHPSDCCLCKEPFIRTHATVKTWQVTVRDQRVRLTCPNCWGIVIGALDGLAR